MKPFAVIIPDRGDRPDFLTHCLMQLKRQTIQPDALYLINYAPENDTPDLTARIYKGIEHAKNDEIDRVFIMENDDYYPDNYLENMNQFDGDFIGIPFTTLYHLKGFHARLNHHQPMHSGLFCTGFSVEALRHWRKPDADTIFLDMKIWEFAREANKTISRYHPIIGSTPIGIKHATGLCGSSQHNSEQAYYKRDHGYRWLKQNVRKESLDFYMSIINHLNY